LQRFLVFRFEDAAVIQDGGMGGFGVFVLVLFLLFLAYFFGGMIIMRMRGASGLELIPHYYFWSNLPSNIKNGVTYCINGCRAADTYEQI